jgi:hypothetical protein
LSQLLVLKNPPTGGPTQQQVAQGITTWKIKVGLSSNDADAAVWVEALVAAPSNEVTLQHFGQASSNHGNNSRLCSDLLTRLKRHLLSIVSGLYHGKTGVVCGLLSNPTCKLCGDKPFHFFPSSRKGGKSAGKDCFFRYHLDTFFGSIMYFIASSNKPCARAYILFYTPDLVSENATFHRYLTMADFILLN